MYEIYLIDLNNLPSKVEYAISIYLIIAFLSNY